jgi:hypothetical protein
MDDCGGPLWSLCAIVGSLTQAGGSYSPVILLSLSSVPFSLIFLSAHPAKGHDVVVDVTYVRVTIQLSTVCLILSATKQYSAISGLCMCTCGSVVLAFCAGHLKAL